MPLLYIFAGHGRQKIPGAEKKTEKTDFREEKKVGFLIFERKGQSSEHERKLVCFGCRHTHTKKKARTATIKTTKQWRKASKAFHNDLK